MVNFSLGSFDLKNGPGDGRQRPPRRRAARPVLGRPPRPHRRSPRQRCSIFTHIEGLTPDKVSHRLSTLGNNWILGRFICNSEMERQYLLASGSHPQNS